MSTRPNPDRAISEWLSRKAEAGAPERLLTATRRQLESTDQRRAWWPARRSPDMNNSLGIAVAAAAVVAVAVVGINLMPGQGSGGPGTSPPSSPPSSPSRSSATPPAAASPSAVAPEPLVTGPLAPGTYLINPSTHPAWTGCPDATTPGCSDPLEADSIRFTVTVPDGWAGADSIAIWPAEVEATPPSGASRGFSRGSWLHSDPCRTDAGLPDVAVGPTVDDFANALADNELLEVTPPVDVTLGGYSGKYVDLVVPADISRCPTSYFAWEPGIYAQGPGHRWHLWILDVEGVRVVVQSTDYAGTSSQHREELQAIVDSITIEP
jgi:hypothetical protein